MLEAPRAAEPPSPPTRRELLCYSVGNSASSLGNAMFAMLNYPIFNMALGLNPGRMGTMATIRRVWDAITDPVIGHISDRTRSRWGRRRPYLVVGSILIAALVSTFFLVREGWSHNAILAWYLTGLLLYRRPTRSATPLAATPVRYRLQRKALSLAPPRDLSWPP